MRSSHLLEPLLTPTQQGILATTILRPDRRWYFRELAEHLRLSPPSIQRDLAAFTSAGILQRSKNGNRVYYQADRACPIFPELEGVLLETVGLVDVLRGVLKPMSRKLDVVFVHGSITSREENSRSDVDLIAVGGIGLADLATVLRSKLLFVQGTRDDLERLAATATRKAPRDEPAGDPRSAPSRPA